MKLTRDTLQTIREEAKTEADSKYLNPDWKRAFERLASAADHLDAMQARGRS